MPPAIPRWLQNRTHTVPTVALCNGNALSVLVHVVEYGRGATSNAIHITQDWKTHQGHMTCCAKLQGMHRPTPKLHRRRLKDSLESPVGVPPVSTASVVVFRRRQLMRGSCTKASNMAITLSLLLRSTRITFSHVNLHRRNMFDQVLADLPVL